jgi:hypothetical protein
VTVSYWKRTLTGICESDESEHSATDDKIGIHLKHNEGCSARYECQQMHQSDTKYVLCAAARLHLYGRNLFASFTKVRFRLEPIGILFTQQTSFIMIKSSEYTRVTSDQLPATDTQSWLLTHLLTDRAGDGSTYFSVNSFDGVLDRSDYCAAHIFQRDFVSFDLRTT